MLHLNVQMSYAIRQSAVCVRAAQCPTWASAATSDCSSVVSQVQLNAASLATASDAQARSIPPKQLLHVLRCGVCILAGTTAANQSGAAENDLAGHHKQHPGIFPRVVCLCLVHALQHVRMQADLFGSNLLASRVLSLCCAHLIC